MGKFLGPLVAAARGKWRGEHRGWMGRKMWIDDGQMWRGGLFVLRFVLLCCLLVIWWTFLALGWLVAIIREAKAQRAKAH